MRLILASVILGFLLILSGCEEPTYPSNYLSTEPVEFNGLQFVMKDEVSQQDEYSHTDQTMVYTLEITNTNNQTSQYKLTDAMIFDSSKEFVGYVWNKCGKKRIWSWLDIEPGETIKVTVFTPVPDHEVEEHSLVLVVPETHTTQIEKTPDDQSNYKMTC